VRTSRGTWLPEPVVSEGDSLDSGNSGHCSPTRVGLALLCRAGESAGQPKRLAFVLHDMFGVPFRGDRAPLSRKSPGRHPTIGQPGATAGTWSEPRRQIPDLATQPPAGRCFPSRPSRAGDFRDALIEVLGPRGCLPGVDTGQRNLGLHPRCSPGAQGCRNPCGVAGSALRHAVRAGAGQRFAAGVYRPAQAAGGRGGSLGNHRAGRGGISEIDLVPGRGQTGQRHRFAH